MNNREAGDLRRYRAHCDVTVLMTYTLGQNGGKITVLSHMFVLAYFHNQKDFTSFLITLNVAVTKQNKNYIYTFQVYVTVTY